MTAPKLGGGLGFALRPAGGLIAFAVGAGIVFISGPSALGGVTAPLCNLVLELGISTCQLIFTFPQEAFYLLARYAITVGVVLAVPCLFFQAARWMAPSLWRFDAQGIVPFALAGGVMAVLGAAFALFYEAPNAFAPVLISLGDMMQETGFLGVASYAKAALIMAASYAFVLQLPVLAVMMFKSWRTGRAAQNEGMA